MIAFGITQRLFNKCSEESIKNIHFLLINNHEQAGNTAYFKIHANSVSSVSYGIRHMPVMMCNKITLKIIDGTSRRLKRLWFCL